MHKTSLLALVVALVGCDGSKARKAPAAKKEPVSAPAPAAVEPGGLAWGNAIDWRDWSAATSAAKAEGKSVCLVVYANWCPLCKELAPEFNQPALASAAKDLIMVRQDQDAHAPWLEERLGKYGSYLPRVLFLGPDGEVREDLQSGHPRYPYFYASMVADRLVDNMRAASKR